MVGLLAVIAGCGGGQQAASDAESKGIQDRARIAVQYVAVAELHRAADAVFPPGYKLEEQPRLPLNCTAGGTLYGIQYIVNGIDISNNNVYFDRMKQHWEVDGWHVENDGRPYAMFMNATKNDYLTSIRGGIHGQIAIGTSTPCI